MSKNDQFTYSSIDWDCVNRVFTATCDTGILVFDPLDVVEALRTMADEFTEKHESELKAFQTLMTIHEDYERDF